MDKKKDDIICKLNYISGWANDVLTNSKKMIEILQSIAEENPNLSCCLDIIDINEVIYGAEELLRNIYEAKDEITN